HHRHLHSFPPRRSSDLSAKPQNSANTGIRVLELTARDKACEHPDKQCNGASCPLAQGFYDKLPAARQEAVDLAFLDKTALRAVGDRKSTRLNSSHVKIS